ncbi:TadE family protein [Actinomadura miaoliensis]|uniref:TadE family protein n=1 Tax=Actinomadura miaoliensis TaxID=430685 RepID=UPI0031E92A0B
METVIAVPVVLTAVLVTLHAALWFHARNIALSAAQEGVRVARAYGAKSDGSATALAFARSSGDGFLLSPSANASGSNATTVVVRVQGRSLSLIPFVRSNVSQVARGPREKFTTPSGGLPNAAPLPGANLGAEGR